MQLIRQILNKPFGRYVAVGISVYIFELLVIAVAQIAGAGSLLAVAISFWAGLIVSFLLQKLIAFKDRRMHHKVVLAQLLAVGMLVACNFGFTLLVTHVLAGILTTFGARSLALGITTIWNFYLYKTRIFASSDQALID
jgi:putative flippase GtrA